MSFEDREEVPEAQSWASTTPTLSPRVAASKAEPAPVTPPPTTKTSSGSSGLVASMVCRDSSRNEGDSSPFRIALLPPEIGESAPWRPAEGDWPVITS
ncbi:Uncharacterised protein [Mycobacteroides abscessus subsp. abscessus]|nr:Uncharacterised protein [Mycobacteroides abscessus subsp. abscessus]